MALHPSGGGGRAPCPDCSHSVARAASSAYSAAVRPLRHLYVFHYHLLPGGVTTVIRDGLRALLAHATLFPDLRRITVVTAGPADGVLPRADAVAAGAPQVTHERLEAVGYDTAPATAVEQRQLADLLRQRYGDGVWWVHNHHLAKNTRFTGAVLAAAAAGQPMLLQIHDFPECARPANLLRLLREVPASPYPAAANVRFAVLNRRDHAALAAAGLPAERVVLLANPVRPVAPLPAPDTAPARAARAALARAAAAQSLGSGSYTSRRPLWLYPVRVRRRKNVLEAGLLARLAGADLIVTLPASSAAETPYSRLVEDLFAAGTIPGLFGVGERLDACGLSFATLLTAAQRIVSPSVEEGFGFQFVNALQWRRPLLARRLPVLDDLATLLDGYPATIYDAVQCPLPTAARGALLEAYGPGIERVARLLPAGWEDRLRAEMERVLGGESVDFAFLGVAAQTDLLRRAGDRGLLRELQQANAPLLAALRTTPAQLPARDRRIDERYGEAAFARRVAAALRFLRTGEPAADPTGLRKEGGAGPKATRGGDGFGALGPLTAPPPTASADVADVTVQPEAVRRFFAGPATLRLLMQS